jgi:uncharacterized heparinase superfamily protein
MARKSTIGVEDGARPAERIGQWAQWLGLLLGGVGGSPFTGVMAAAPRHDGGKSAAAQDLYRGQFTFAGHTIVCQPADVFSVDPPTPQWDEALLSFAWLGDLASSGLALYRAFARSLVLGFFAQRRRGSFEARCRRLWALSCHGSFLVTGAGAGFEGRFLRHAGNEAQTLAALKARTPAAQLRQAAALLAAGLAFRGGEALRDDALARLCQVVPQLILGDGGPADRSPATLLAILADLVPLRAAMAEQRIAIPADLNAALERALPMLRMLCHGDGGLALFHGVSDPAPATCAAVMAGDDVDGRPLAHAPQSGYCRLSQSGAAVILDCGLPAVADSPLAIEFSAGPQRIVGSCGFPASPTPAWAAAACRSAAHSTLTIEGEAPHNLPSFFARRPRQPESGPVSAELIASPHGTLVKARNGLPVTEWGIAHLRELFLAAGGRDFRGEDSFVRADHRDQDWPDAAFTLRFHLHPDLRANLDRNRSSVTLVLPDRAVWQFTARGGALALEESIFLSTGGAPLASQQVVIRGHVGRPQRVNWAFRRI